MPRYGEDRLTLPAKRPAFAAEPGGANRPLPAQRKEDLPDLAAGTKQTNQAGKFPADDGRRLRARTGAALGSAGHFVLCDSGFASQGRQSHQTKSQRHDGEFRAKSCSHSKSPLI